MTPKDRLKLKRQVRLAKAPPQSRHTQARVDGFNSTNGTYSVREGRDLIPDCQLLTNGAVSQGQAVARKGDSIIGPSLPKKEKRASRKTPSLYKPIAIVFSVDDFEVEEVITYVGGILPEAIEVFRTPFTSTLHEVFVNNYGNGEWTVDAAIDDTIRQYDPNGLVWEIHNPYATIYDSGWWWRGHGFWTTTITRSEDPTIPEDTQSIFVPGDRTINGYVYRVEQIWDGKVSVSDLQQSLDLTLFNEVDGTQGFEYSRKTFVWILPNQLWEFENFHLTMQANGSFVGTSREAGVYGYTWRTFPTNREGNRAIEYEGTMHSSASYPSGDVETTGTEYSLSISKIDNEFKVEKLNIGDVFYAGIFQGITNLIPFTGDKWNIWDYFYFGQIELFDNMFTAFDSQYGGDITNAISGEEDEFTRTYQVYNYDFERLDDIELTGYVPQESGQPGFYIWWKGTSIAPT